MSKAVAIDDVIDLLKEKLSLGGSITFTPNGTSMLPMLRDGKDVVTLRKPEGKLKKYDVPLYKRDNGGYVLHRIVGFDPDGNYIMCGDNQFALEYGITDKHIIAIMTSFKRKGKSYTTDSFSYKLYVRFHYHTRYIRRYYRAIKRRAFGLIRKGNR